MGYRVAICDDVEEDARYFASVVRTWGEEGAISLDVEIFPSAESFLFRYEEDKAYDILLLDVQMQGVSGIELARRVRSGDPHVEIIFTTSHFELSSEGYEVDALHYLVKPVPRDKLMEVLSKAARRLAAQPPPLVVHCGGETVKLPVWEIMYVESFLHYIVIHTREGEYRLKENLSAMEARLGSDFYRTHRSYLVSLKHIRRISRTSVWLESGKEIPLARGKYDDIHRAFIRQN